MIPRESRIPLLGISQDKSLQSIYSDCTGFPIVALVASEYKQATAFPL